MRSARLVPCAVLLGVALPAAAQFSRTDTPTPQASLAVPRFQVQPSPIGLSGDVRPMDYLGVVGPRSAWLGRETGEAELWVHPLKVASGFQLGFVVPGYRDPVRGRNVARTVEIRPELTTITYTHAAFTVRQHILAPLAGAGLLVLLDVQTTVPLQILAEFEPVLQYMWPGAFGGQYVFWDETNRAFVLSESVQERNAVLGSPWATSSDAHPAHALGDAPATLVIPVDSARARAEFIPIAVAAGTMPREQVFAAYRDLLGSAEALYRQKRAWADSVLAATTRVDTPDDELDLALEWAKVNLEEQRVCNPDLGCGFVAGWGPSGVSTRPGFGWFFGGDAAINTLAMDVTGQWDRVAEALRFLARYQRDDGKIPHEISQAAGRMNWFEEYPYPYYHADTTPYWMLAVWHYWRATGDGSFVREMWPAYRKAWAWCLSAETDGDAIIENTVGGYGAVEVGDLGEALHEDIYLASVWTAALSGTAELARTVGDDAVAANAASLFRVARQTLNERYWRPQEGHHAFAILAGGATNDNLTAWPATAAAFGLLDDGRAGQTLRKLATDSISSDWGARMLSTGSPLYDPLHYNNGTVWPFVTGFVSWGQYRYRRPWAGFHLVNAVKSQTFDFARGRHGELYSGAFYQPLDETVPHQFFATSMLVTPLLRGILGWAPNAPAGSATLAPQLPPTWGRVSVEGLRVGGATVDVELTQFVDSAVARIHGEGAPVMLRFVQSVPLGARSVRLLVDGRERRIVIGSGDHDQQLPVELALDGERHEIRVSWVEGVRVAPPPVPLTPGQRSEGLRVADFRRQGSAWILTVEGEAGRTYFLDLYGQYVGPDSRRSNAQVEGRDAGSGRTRLRIPMPPGSGRRSVTIPLLPARSPG